MKVVNLKEKYSLFNEHWCPKIVASLNGQHVKLAKIKGEFIWHKHDDADELFWVSKGTLKIEFRDGTKVIKEGEMLVVPKGVEHKPIADEEVHIMMFEPAGTSNTGKEQNERTVSKLEYI